MKAYSFDGERFGYYGYDASGERTYKIDFDATFSKENGVISVQSLDVEKMTLYPNGYVNINQNGEYTKHYYADALRIASKIGSGFTGNLCDSATATYYSYYLNALITFQSDFMVDELNEVVVPLQNIQQINPMPYPTFCNLDSGGQETNLFFYHPDHLGSTGVVTDNNANVTQGFLYSPFGELIYEHNPSWENNRVPKYAFNAKELDEENGMYYYSARYYAPPTFISRDPMFEKYPSINPYSYCRNNPVIRIDPTGMNDEVFINGPEAEAAFSQLQKSTSLKLERNAETGQVTIVGGTAKTEDDKQLQAAIQDTKIKVNVTAESSSENYDGGAFDGNTVIPNEQKDKNNLPSVETNQKVDPFETAVIDVMFGDKKGQTILHEITESYKGGRISQSLNKSASPAIRGVYNPIYDDAHYGAVKQPCIPVTSETLNKIFDTFRELIKK